MVAGPLPDLLHPTPESRIDVEHTTRAVSFAFASGVTSGLFTDALDRATKEPSTWRPEAFAGDLFVRELAATCFAFDVDGAPAALALDHLVGVLSRPPSDPAVPAHRRAVLRELVESSELRAALEHLYALLAKLRAGLEGAAGIGKWDPNRRELDILSVVKDLFDCMAERFDGAKSGLRALHDYASSVRETEPYRSLADLLGYDDALATLSLKVTVGADGKLRGFRVLSVQEDSKNPFVNSAPRRWLAKLELFARGFRFSDAEVLSRLIDAVFEGVVGEIVRFVQLLGDVEVYLGALAFRDRALAAGLAVCLPELASAERPRSVVGLFNPLLLAHRMKPVPCDLALDRHDAIVLVTGPNSGGKTRLLQSVALAQLLAQGGLFVPATEATIAPVPALVVSLIQETKADQPEGHLGMELVRIRELFEELPPGAMVILDELCSGTNPSEGEEIFELVVRMLAKLRPQTFITTHFLAFAARLEREKALDSLRFLEVVLGPTQEPTYQFAPGVAKTSLAAHTAARLGVTGEQLLALVEQNLRRGAPP